MWTLEDLIKIYNMVMYQMAWTIIDWQNTFKYRPGPVSNEDITKIIDDYLIASIEEYRGNNDFNQ